MRKATGWVRSLLLLPLSCIAFALPAVAAATSVPCDVTSLVNAINTANGTVADDTLDLASGCTYTLTGVDNTDATYGPNGLPEIVTAASAGTLTINGNGATIIRDSNAPTFRIFYVGSGANLTLNNLTVGGGRADVNNNDLGGGILVGGQATLTVTMSVISNNYANQVGGAIYADQGATVTVTDSTVAGNAAPGGGGIEIVSGATITVANSTFSSNDAEDGGGLTSFGSATIVNSTIAGNTAFTGGGIHNFGSMTVTNSTIAGNDADGGGIYNETNAAINLNNTIVANNTNGGNGANDCITNSGTVNASHSLIMDGTNACGLTNGTNGNIVGSDPLLGPLANNGGPTQTRPPGAGSPVIDAGDNSLIPGGVQYDQRGAGFPRISNGTVDMGAVEVQQPPSPRAPTPAPAMTTWGAAILGLLLALLGAWWPGRRPR